MDTLLRDLRFALKSLLRRPMITAAAVLCLGIGIGATTVVYSLVDAVLLRPLPYRDPEGISTLWLHFPSEGVPTSPLSTHEFLDLREQAAHAFGELGALTPWSFNLTDTVPPQRLNAARVSAEVWGLLGARPAQGRTFTAAEEERGDSVAVISHALWQRAFGGDPDVLGRRITLSDVPHDVVGVMAPDFRPVLDGVEVWVPLTPQRAGRRDMRRIRVLARFADGVGPERAQADLDEIESRFAADYPDLYSSGWGMRLVPLLESEVGEVRGRLTAFLGAVALVLLIACINVASLLMTQATAREKEVALRVAVGAGRGALVRQFLTESVTLAALGGLLGLGLAYLGIELVVRLQLGNIPRLEEVGIDLGVLGFTLAASLLVGIGFGLAPALTASVPRLHAALKEGGKTSAASRRHPLRSALVVVEVTFAVVVLIGAGLMMRSFLRLQEVDPGFRADGLVTMQLDLPFPAYGPIPDRLDFYRRFSETLHALPGIESAGLISHLPFTIFGLAGSIEVEGRDTEDSGPLLGWRMISPELFKTMGIPLLKGRLFDERDHVDATPRAAILDEATANRLWPEGGDPIGRRVKMVGWVRDEWRQVVGVVGSVKHHSLAEDAEQLYVPFQQAAVLQVGIVLRTSMDALTAAASVRDALRALDPSLPVVQPRLMEDLISDSLSGPRFNLVLFALFAAIALVLAAVGIYGVMSYSVSQRTSEIGLRCALGARRREVLTLILGQGLKLAVLGLGLGLVLAWALTFLLSRLLGGILYGVSATDVATFVGVPVVLLAVSLVACLLPARRAALIDPMRALREE
ncbi:MAG TPA: ABC transporter permease [Thermoanaerobaculia bacterium]|jgi:putative ABC transport system permease protein